MPERFLSVEAASVGYGRAAARAQALRNVSLSFKPGQLSLIMGPSGSGKTTLLSVLGCLLTPDSGKVYVRDREVSGIGEAARTELRRRSIGFVFQAFRLFRSLTALDNVTISGDICGQPGQKQRAKELLEELGLGDKMHLKPDEMSGGEKQRVAIARVLTKDPPILLADEPTASLDTAAGQQISELLFKVAAGHGRAVVVVSHDSRWEPFAHRLIILRDGEVIQDRSQQA